MQGSLLVQPSLTRSNYSTHAVGEYKLDDV